MQVDYKDIFGFAQNYRNRLNNVLGQGVANPKVGDDIFTVLMEKDNVKRLLDLTDCNKIAAIMGIHKNDAGEDELTISLLAVNSSNAVLPGHISGSIPGEEVWPQRINIDGMNDFLPEPK